MSDLFCRHNRFTADCPICSRGTVLDQGRGRPSSGTARTRSAPAKRRAEAPPAARSYPHVSAGPYERDEGDRYEVRLERVPGGIRLAQWSRGALERRAPVLPAPDLRRLVDEARERAVVAEGDAGALTGALGAAADGGTDGAEPWGASPGRTGDLRDELRVEAVDDMLRIARWVLRPGRGWELQEAPPMLPAARYAEALAEAGRRGLLG